MSTAKVYFNIHTQFSNQCMEFFSSNVLNTPLIHQKSENMHAFYLRLRSEWHASLSELSTLSSHSLLYRYCSRNGHISWSHGILDPT